MERKLRASLLLLLAAAFLALISCSDTLIDDVKEKIVDDQIEAGIDPFPDAPLVTAIISSDAGEFTNRSSLYIEIEFSEEIDSLSLAQLSCSNCTASDLFTEDKINYSLTLVPLQDGKVQMVVPVNTVESVATYKKNTEAVFETVYDGTAPGMPDVSGVTPTPNTRPTWSWTGSGESGAVFRYKLGDSDFSSGATETTETSFTPASDLAETEWRLYVQERDDAGNWSPAGSFAIVIDTAVPDKPNFLTENMDTFTNELSPSWHWESGGNGGVGLYRYKINDSDLESDAVLTDSPFYVLSPPAPDSAETEYTMYIQESSSANLWSATSSYTITVDRINPPFPEIVFPADTHGLDDGIYRTGISFEINESSIEKFADLTYKYRINGGSWTSPLDYTLAVPLTGAAGQEYEYDLEVTQTDRAGNNSINTASVTIDRNVPAAPTISGLVDNQIRGSADSFTIGYDNADCKAYYTTNGSGYSLYGDSPVSLGGVAGDTVNYTVRAYQIDNAGNESNYSTTYDVTIDREAPSSPDVSGPSEVNTTEATWTWESGGSSDSAEIYSYRLNVSSRDTSDAGSSATQHTEEGLSEGTHTLYVWERDAIGNWQSSPGSHPIEVDFLPSGSMIIRDPGNSNSTTVATDWSVSLDSSGIVNATEMRFRNSDGDFGSWETFAASKTWILSPGDGTRRVYAEYRDSQQNVHSTSDSISCEPGWGDVGANEILLWPKSSDVLVGEVGSFSGDYPLAVGEGFVFSYGGWEGTSPMTYVGAAAKVVVNSRDETTIAVKITGYSPSYTGGPVTWSETYSSTWKAWHCNPTIYIDLNTGATSTSLFDEADISIFYSTLYDRETITSLHGVALDRWDP